jgi:hypothetical protein
MMGANSNAQSMNAGLVQHKMKKSPCGDFSSALVRTLRRCALSVEARLAEHRLTALLNGARLKRHLAGGAALGAHCIVHLSSLRSARVAASLAPLGGAQVLTCVELLLAFREGESCAAIAALKLLISHRTEKKEIKLQIVPSRVLRRPMVSVDRRPTKEIACT